MKVRGRRRSALRIWGFILRLNSERHQKYRHPSHIDHLSHDSAWRTSVAQEAQLSTSCVSRRRPWIGWATAVKWTWVRKHVRAFSTALKPTSSSTCRWAQVRI